MGNKNIKWSDLTRIFLSIGALAFGGWSTTALLLEKKLVHDRKVLTLEQVHSAVAYAQILPGGTQVAIVSNIGYKLRGKSGALVATFFYLLPGLSLITLFAVFYFHFLEHHDITKHIGGLVAALGGVILANAHRIGQRHVSHPLLWLAVIGALGAKLFWNINAVLIILSFGFLGLLYSLTAAREESQDA